MIESDPPAVGIDAVWPGQPPTPVDQFGPVYGRCIEMVADGLMLANGDRPSRRNGVVVCYESRLTEPQAHLLTEFATDIFLPRLEALQPDVARILGRTTGILHFATLQSLDAAAARELAGGRAVLSLNAVNHLSAEAAAGVARSEGPLNLDGLSDFEPGVAAALAEHVGQLSLNGLRKLSAEDAAALADHRGDLCLNAIESLSAGVADALAALAYGLHLNGLREISLSDAAALSRHRGWCLGVNGLSSERVLPEAFMLICQHHRLRPHQGVDPSGAVLFHDDFRQRTGLGCGVSFPPIYKTLIAK